MEGIIVVSVNFIIGLRRTSQCSVLLQGFDEYMNVVLDDAVEINVKASTRKQIGNHHLSSVQLPLTDGITVISCHIRSDIAEGRLHHLDSESGPFKRRVSVKANYDLRVV
jgi:small nuclear ribonucleoprotein (snRNP)-like protein